MADEIGELQKQIERMLAPGLRPRSYLPKLNKLKRKLRLLLARQKGTHTAEQWEALKREFDYRCVKCGRIGYHLDRDHIVPIYQGGSDGIDNIQPLCAWCNAGKGPEDFNWVEHRRAHGWGSNG